MSVDKDLFMYDLAVVAIMKCEGSYIKEWLDYHLLAGVDHFFIYDNESPDNQKEVLQPYIDAGLVTYTFFPGPSPQFPAYNDAIRRFKYLCRYIAFIDGDEFIFPQSNRSIIEVVDEILADKPYAGGLALNWNYFGPSGQKKADYTRGVLERFIYRAPENHEDVIKNIVNPRRISYFGSPHYMYYHEGFFAINGEGAILPPGQGSNKPATNKKIVINHYVTKSYEEYSNKNKRGDGIYTHQHRKESTCINLDKVCTILDDSILKYRAERFAAQISGGGMKTSILNVLAPRKQIDYNKMYSALIANLVLLIPPNIPRSLLEGKMETFLTCRKLSSCLKKKFFDDKTGNFFEEVALNAVYKTLHVGIQTSDLKLLFSELPNILQLDYPVIKDIRNACVQITQQLLLEIRRNVVKHDPALWDRYFHLEEQLNFLKAFDN